MMSRSWLSMVVLLGTTVGVSAQPYPYGPPPMAPGYGGPGPYATPYPALPQAPLPMAPPRPTTVPSAPAAPQALPTAPRAQAPSEQPQNPAMAATAVLKEGMDQLLAFLGQKEVPNRLQVAAFLDREIAPYFDFQGMAKWAAGPAYERLSNEDQQALQAQIEADFLRTLVTQLMNYQGQQIQVQAPRVGARGLVSVPVTLTRPGSYPARLEFRMHQTEQGWQIADVLADGQSAAAYYRVQFQRMAGQGDRAPSR
ncbi:toluene tolerance protein [Thiocapsa imhoffii]|uniref:Toluene tolerance protein n=1 Tax=Thiocapsa imhoffii TaxID=382777 RepID=A0A9X0WF44_9GAMM|nr:ABC transporter substrate-binding protein [Thiocapsa imhoffii]MBK1643546.1 toluene tolerance protein [Thiocapsa imhoffii]